jgi:signal transduction histidine kinase
LLVATTRAGEVTGMLPFSRMTHYPRYTVASEPSEVLRLDVSFFREMLDVSLEVARRFVAQMSDRVRGDVRLEQQSEKMMALGRLSAGLAHELNNPATAVRRGAATLAEHRGRLPLLVTALARHQIGDAGLERLVELRLGGGRDDTTRSSALERSDREDELSDWLEDHEFTNAWEIVPVLAQAGVTLTDLKELSALVPSSALSDGLTWLGGGLESDQVVAEIGEAARRIAELVAAVKVYSHMDRSPEHKPTDVRDGLDNTLTMLDHQLRAKAIRAACEYADDLPLIAANAGELNLVWTNLINNAVDAMAEGGALVLRAQCDDTWVEVEVVDDGPGIPDDIRPRIFEPFFTTKEVGKGPGLGLGIANRIVETHQGHIEVQSKPGRTVVCVRLPLSAVG